MHLVSVLMCVYNTKLSYLKESIDSILNQTYKELEFVIVNDGSTDTEVCDYLNTLPNNDSRIKLVNLEENMGLTKALNKGLDMCHGFYIARMDADDISKPERIEQQVKYMDENEEVSLLGTDIETFGENVISVNTENEYAIIDNWELYRIESIFGHSGPPHPTFMFRSQFLNEHKIKYPENIVNAQDYGIMAEILKNGGVIRKLRKSLLMYRVHENQITSNRSDKQLYYQGLASEGYVRFLFPFLSNQEIMAFAHLKDFSYSCAIHYYKEAVKKVIEYNNKNALFDKSLFEKHIKKYLRKRVSKKITRELHLKADEILYDVSFILSRFESDKKYIEKNYIKKIGTKPDLDKPITYNEKLQWLKLNDRKPIYHALVDKYEVKNYISANVGEKYAIPNLGKWTSIEEIDFDKLPDSFVLKCTHDSGSIVVVQNKKDFNKDEACRILQKSLKTDYYRHSREWVYKGVKPGIIAEPLLEDGSGKGLVDYKVHCFEGEPKYIEVIGERDFHNHTGKVAFYDFEWNRLNWSFGDYPFFENDISRPSDLEKVYEISKKLSSEFKYIRLDYYLLSTGPIIGEITFYPSAGFNVYNDVWTKELDVMLGELISSVPDSSLIKRKKWD